MRPGSFLPQLRSAVHAYNVLRGTQNPDSSCGHNLRLATEALLGVGCTYATSASSVTSLVVLLHRIWYLKVPPEDWKTVRAHYKRARVDYAVFSVSEMA